MRKLHCGDGSHGGSTAEALTLAPMLKNWFFSVPATGRVPLLTLSFVLILQFVDIGIVTSIEINHKQVDVAKKGQEVCVKIEPIPGESPKMYGRHFEATDILVSKVSPSARGAPLRRRRDCWFPHSAAGRDWWWAGVMGRAAHRESCSQRGRRSPRSPGALPQCPLSEWPTSGGGWPPARFSGHLLVPFCSDAVCASSFADQPAVH